MARPGSPARCGPRAAPCGTSPPNSRGSKAAGATSSASARSPAQFNARTASLASVAASLDGVEGKSLCLLVDQFEELFRYEKETSRDEAELFVDLVGRAAAERETRPRRRRSTSM